MHFETKLVILSVILAVVLLSTGGLLYKQNTNFAYGCFALSGLCFLYFITMQLKWYTVVSLNASQGYYSGV